MGFTKKLSTECYVRMNFTVPQEVSKWIRNKKNMSTYITDLVCIDMNNHEASICEVCKSAYVKSFGCEKCRIDQIKKDMGCEI